ncbi:MAG: bifunctional 4-hydroxy-2-oxoglutarate aldolase/2-dehydro-3-deoxy-phosphogluconate aldolase [Deltaproteobacteria bacterium]|nr:bifunctional 4-hydroxy-2-oxoglutarate aldolase/2-dehydro-3-deoxy-phosphogluconate aldolase [Deltaproteobacteria bacterium]
MNPQDFVETFGQRRASAILRCDDQQTANDAMEAAVRGGFTILEFTLTVPGAYELIADFSRRDGLILGAGTVLETSQAERAVEHGAQFLVSPVVDPEVIAAAGNLGVAAMPGTHTPTEMNAAHRAGAQLQKLFPTPGLGPSYVKACLGPLPFLRIVPTNGVDEENALEWLEAGAFALGFVATLFSPQDLQRRNFDAIEERARRILARVGEP